MNVLAALVYLDRARAPQRLTPTAKLWAVYFFVAAVAFGAHGCRGRETSEPQPLAPTQAVMDCSAPAVAPELIAGFRVAQPEFAYAAIRGLSARPLPQSLQVLLPSLVGLNPALSGRFSTGHDWLGVVTAEANGATHWAVGVPVTSGRELVAELSLGSDAHLRAQPRAGWTELTGSNGGLLGPLSLGISGNYLLLGSSPTAVRTLAPWLNRRGGAAALAPEQGDAGLSVRLLASGLTVQALHAHLRERWEVDSAPWSAALGSALEVTRVAEIEEQLNDAISAYVGALRSGDAHLRWQGREVALSAEFEAPALPSPARDAGLCREIAALPRDVKFWVAGVGSSATGETRVEPSSVPDWQHRPGQWQSAVFNGFGAIGGPLAGKVRLNPNIAVTDGPWLIGWSEQGRASTALAVLGGIPIEAIESTPLLPFTPAGSRVQAKADDGKVLEWAWAPRGAGVAIALGAQLGATSWEQWVKVTSGTGWPSGLSPSLCEGLIFAAGHDRETSFSISRDAAVLQVKGSLDLSTFGGLSR